MNPRHRVVSPFTHTPQHAGDMLQVITPCKKLPRSGRRPGHKKPARGSMVPRDLLVNGAEILVMRLR